MERKRVVHGRSHSHYEYSGQCGGLGGGRRGAVGVGEGIEEDICASSRGMGCTPSFVGIIDQIKKKLLVQ